MLFRSSLLKCTLSPSPVLLNTLIRIDRTPNFCVRLGTLSNTETYAWAELTWSGHVARAIKFVNPISKAVGHTVEEVLVNVLFIEMSNGRDVSFDQPAAKASRVRFSDNGKEPSRRRLNAAQELVRTLSSGARTVPITIPHSCFHQASNEGRIEIAHIWSVIVNCPSGYVV